ncbi:MAG: cell division protein [Sphingomonas sp.]|nr:cell division protein [Sphingomonas sp.]
MMMAASTRGLLPTERLHLPTAAVIGIMTFAMILVGAAGLALSNASGAVAQGIENRFIVQLPAGLTDQLPGALALVRSTPGVRHAEPVPESEMRETLRRWLGDAASSRDLPVPALVTVELAPSADSGALRQRVEAAIPGATVVAQSAELRPLLRSIRALQWLAVSLVALIVAATAAAVVLAARGAFDTHRPTIEIMHGIGATDLQLTRLFQRKIAVDAVAGAAAGTIAAGLGLLMVGGGGAAVAGGLADMAPLAPGDLAILAALPILAIVLATLVARWTVLKALRETL